MEREKFGLRSVQGPRTAGGLPVPVFFDTDIANRDPASHIFGSAPRDPSMWHSYFNDFDTYVAGDWTITEVGSGSRALTDVDGGALLITNAAADDDHNFLQKKGESFLMALGKPALFGARFKVSDATQSDFIMGLQITDTSPLDVTDGVFFQKDDGDALLDFHVEKNNTATDATGIATVVDDTFLAVQWYFDGVSRIYYAVNGVVLGFLAITNMVDDEELTVSIAIQNGEAVAKTMTIDYVWAAKYRG